MHYVLNWIVQGALVALLVFVLLRALEQARASARHLLCLAGLLVVLVLPLLPRGWQPAAPSLSPASSDMTANALLTVPNAWWTSSAGVMLVCACWVAVFGVRIARAVVFIRKARARCGAFPPPIESQLRNWRTLGATGRRTRLAVVDGVGSAAVLGLGSPIIAVTPALFEHLTCEELDRVIVHEWSHVQRRDDLLNLLQLAARAFAGWHPAVWWLNRRLVIEREMACDEMVVALTGSTRLYASSLATVASLAPAGWTALASLGALSSSALTRRVTRILSCRKTFSRFWSAAALAGSGLLLTLSAFGVVGVRPVAQVDLDTGRAMSTPMTAAAVQARSDRLASVQPRRDSDASSVGTPVTRAKGAGRTRRISVVRPQPSPAEPSSSPSLDTLSPPSVAPVAEPTLPSMPLPLTSSILSSTEGVHGPARLSQPAPKEFGEAAGGDQPASPWAAVAGAGTAIGRGSQKAGLATASFFNRMGKKIARSF